MWKTPGLVSALALGFALGGFFDGILLHQILQWHHLLSLVPGMDDLRLQVLWDGYFHALMYVIAALGLWGLWRARRKGSLPGGTLAGALLVGFGLWHVTDALLSHWLLGIHRIRLDDDPLFWDLLWLALFGLIPAAIGWMLLRGKGRPGRGSAVAMVLLTAGTLGAAVWSLQAPPDQRFTTVVFRPDLTPPQVFAAIMSLDARIVWTDTNMGVVVVDMDAGRGWEFYTRGALLVGGSGLPAGCINWTEA